MNLAKDLDFSGRRVLVTGAANGFGAAMAECFVAQGARVILADREEAPLMSLAGRLGMAAHLYDQADLGSIERLHAEVGEIDVLINNAGMMVAKSLLETSAEEMRQMIET